MSSTDDASGRQAVAREDARAPSGRRHLELLLHGRPQPLYTVRCECGWESPRASSAGLAQSMGTAHAEAHHPQQVR